MTDDVIKRYLDEIKTTLESRLDQTDARIAESANKSIGHHERTRREIRHVQGQVISLWRYVRGSDPPPPSDDDVAGLIVDLTPTPPTGTPVYPGKAKPIDELVLEGLAKTSSVDLDLAAFKGEMIGELAALQTTVGNVAKAVLGVGKETKKQSDVLGIDKKGKAWIASREGMKQIGIVVAAVASLIGATAGLVAAVKGSPPPAQQIQQVPHASP